MNIERSGTAASPNTVAGVASQGAKGKVKTGDVADAPEGGGFSAILTSLEPEATVGAGSVGTGDQPAAADTQWPAEEQPPLAVLLPSDPLIPLAQNLPNDLAMLLAQAGTVASDKPSTFSDVRRPFEAKGGIQLAAAAMGSAKPETPVAASAPLAAGKSGEFKQHVDALLEQAAQGLPAEAQKARGTELQLDVAAKLAESHALRPPSLGDGVAREPALSGALLTSSMGDSFLRQADKATSKSSFLPAGSGIEGIWGQQAFQTSSRVDAPSVMVDPSTLSLESMVADTVSYWVTQGVQNAELKLDGFGGQPVEVSITLKGDEAHIGFRTDQPEIRQILEGAVAHLKDLLTSEGLVLSGVSVGTSGQDGAGAQEQRNRQGTRQATITTMEPVPTESRQRANPSVGRAVDLFV